MRTLFNIKNVLALLLCIVSGVSTFAQSINSFTPVSARAGLQGSASITIDGTGFSTTAADDNYKGAARVFTRSGGVWTQQGNKLVAIGNTAAANQGSQIALSADSSKAMIGGWHDNSSQGAVWMFGAAPNITNVHIQSDNTTPTLAKQGNIITLNFTSDITIQTPTITLAGVSASVTNTSGNNWQGTIPVTGSTVQGVVSVTVTATSLDGTASSTAAATTDASSVIIDRTLPTLSSIQIQSNNSNTAVAVSGDVITLSFSASETITTPVVTIAGISATVTNISGNSWQGVMTVSNSTTQGIAAMKIDFTDLAGNVGFSKTGTLDNSVVRIGAPGPVITAFTPGLGRTGSQGTTTITITGTGFNTTAAKNIVFFGAVYTPAITATATQLTVNVPAGATCQYLSVMNTETGLSSYSYNQNPFVSNYYNEGSLLFSPAAVFSYTHSSNFLPSYFRLADIDGDGKPDIIFAPTTGNMIAILRNTSTPGSVSFDAGNIYSAGTQIVGKSVSSIAISDLTGDGKPEIVLALSTGITTALAVFPNLSSTGNISLGTRFDIAPTLTGNGFDIGLADADGDGRTDIITSPYVVSDGAVRIYRNSYTNAAGFQFDTTNFKAPVTIASRNDDALRVISADFNGDNKPDIATVFHYGGYDTSFVNIFYNNSTPGKPDFSSYSGKFTLGLTLSSSIDAGNLYFTGAVDLNGDGKPDMVTANYGGNNINTLLNLGTQGSGNLAARVGITLGTGTAPGSLALGDLDGDGKFDLAATSESTNSVYIQRNNANAASIRVASKVTLPVLSSPRYMEICDIDGDGLPDVIVMNLTTISIYSSALKKNRGANFKLPF